MALTRELQIFKDAKVLMTDVDVVVTNMRRERKFNLGTKMFSIAMEIPELIGHSNRVSGLARRDTLNKVLEKLDHLDFMVNYCQEREYIRMRDSSKIIHNLDKVVKQATGWRNSVRG